MGERKPLVIIGGATGVGKTKLSVELAKRLDGEIISADSMQVYKGFDIGTAKITPGEMENIPHHLIDILEPDQEFNIYEFKSRAVKAIGEICCRGRIPIIVGGTGFYIQSVLYNVDFTEDNSDKSYRRYLEELAGEKGCGYVYGLLEKVDPESAGLIHTNNVKRVIRALEYYHDTGEPISKHNSEQKENISPYNFAYFVLNRKRETIYDRINRRIDKMIGDGLEDEVRSLLGSGISPDSLAMQGIGYKEMIPYIGGLISLSEAAEQLKLNTRHFAKRQNTWFKREKDAIWVNYEDFPDEMTMLDFILENLKERNII